MEKISSEQYVEHEVQIRVMQQLNDERYKITDDRFKSMAKSISSIDNKITGLIIFLLGSLVLPVSLHFFKLI